MAAFNIIEAIVDLTNVLSPAPTENNKGKKNILYVLLFSGMIWLVYELKPITQLLHPIWFLMIFTPLSILLAIVSIIGIFKMAWIKYMDKKEFFILLISLSCILISFFSLANRTFGSHSSNYISCIVPSDPKHSNTSSSISILLDSNFINYSLPAETGILLHKNDTVIVERATGALGFDRISNVMTMR
jgi:hypothetical protein